MKYPIIKFLNKQYSTTFLYWLIILTSKESKYNRLNLLCFGGANFKFGGAQAPIAPPPQLR